MMTTGFLDIFNNRETATGVWLSLIAIYCILKLDVLDAVYEISKLFFGSVLLVVFSGLALWLSLGVKFLYWINWWTISELKLTIYWYLFSGAVLLGHSIKDVTKTPLIGQMVRDQFRVVVLLEFVAVFYSFSLLTELLFVPAITILSAAHIYCKNRSEYESLRKPLELIFVGLAIVFTYNFIAQTIGNKGALWNLATTREVLLPVGLSIWVIPYCYLISCHSRWQEAIIQINQKTYHPENLRKYAHNRFRRSLFFHPTLLMRAVRQFNMLPAKTGADIDDIVTQVFEYENGKSDPVPVPVELGWCPYKSELFLENCDFKTGDFHNSGFDGEWFAESEAKYLEAAGLFETLIYRIQGFEGIIKTLTIKGSFKFDPTPEAGIKQMEKVAADLIKAATAQKTLPKSIKDGFLSARDTSEQLNMHELSLSFTHFDSSNILDVIFTVSTKN